MDSYSEVRRVRKAMSSAAGHDVRKLAAMFNDRRTQVADRIIDPGTKAEQTAAREQENVVQNGYSTLTPLITPPEVVRSCGGLGSAGFRYPHMAKT